MCTAVTRLVKFLDPMSDGDTIYASSPPRRAAPGSRWCGFRDRWRRCADRAGGQKAAAARGAAGAAARRGGRDHRSRPRALFPRTGQRHRRGCGRASCSWQPRRRRRAVREAGAARSAPGGARRIHPPRLPQPETRSRRRRGAGGPRRRRDRDAAPPGTAPARRRAGAAHRGWRARLVAAQARLEAAIDFPEEDLPPQLWERARAEAAALAQEIAAALPIVAASDCATGSRSPSWGRPMRENPA